MQTSFHPAPGLGDLLNGWFIVPQNPVRNDTTTIVPSVQALAPNHVLRVKSMGDLVSGAFVVPQNPVAKNTGLSGCGCAGGCGTCGGSSNYGLSGFDFSSITDWAQQASPVAGLPNWLLYGGLGLGAYMLLAPGGSEYRSKSRALKSEYRGYRRLAQRVAA